MLGPREQRIEGRFEIEAFADPQALMRIMGYFAQRSFVPLKLRCDLVSDVLHVDLTVGAIEPAIAEILSAKLSSMPLVLSVKYEMASGQGSS